MVADESLAGHDLECPQCHQLRRVPASVQLAQHAEERFDPATAPPELPSEVPAHLPATLDATPRSPAAQEQYRCNNPDCGGLWLETQLLVLEHGETAVRVCPNCRLVPCLMIGAVG